MACRCFCVCVKNLLPKEVTIERKCLNILQYAANSCIYSTHIHTATHTHTLILKLKYVREIRETYAIDICVQPDTYDLVKAVVIHLSVESECYHKFIQQ